MKRGAGGRRDAAWREIGRAAITEFNQHGRAERPRCGAKAKHTGMPCQNLGLENGRCHLHGGRTPKGDQWHRLQLPQGPGGSLEKLNRKLRDAARHEKRRAARVAAMNPKERAAYDAWHRAHKPGSISERDMARRDREAARGMLAPRVERPPSPAEVALAAEIALLKERCAELAWILGEPSTDAAGVPRGNPKE